MKDNWEQLKNFIREKQRLCAKLTEAAGGRRYLEDSELLGLVLEEMERLEKK